MSGDNTMLEIQRALGRIEERGEALAKHLERQDVRMDKIDSRLEAVDSRLQAVEQKAAVSGATMGIAASVGMALAIEGMKAYFKVRP